MNGTPNLAVLADYENVALGARDVGLDPFRIELVLERLLDKGKVLLKKAYCDWGRYASDKRPLHEAGFELVEVPHARYSGKNSADLRLAVDAVDLCHTRPHLDTFAIISGDSDFSPLVGKLREHGKEVIGIGVKASTGRLLVQSCDEFVFYDDLVPKVQPVAASDGAEAVALVVGTARALLDDRGEPVWASHVKQVIKRKQPHFRESSFGFKSFSALVEDASDRGLLTVRKDDASGGYVVTEATPG